MTPFDDYFRLLQLSCTVYHNQQVCGDWALTEHRIGQTCFHLVTFGHCTLDVGGQHDVLGAGDIVLFPRELPHRLRPVKPSSGEMQQRPVTDTRMPDSTGLLCAEIQFEHAASTSLLDTLPDYLIIRADSSEAVDVRPVLGELMRHSLVSGPGGAVVVDRLAEVVFLLMVRQGLAQTRADVFAAYAHPVLGPALVAFHQSPDQPWTLADIATQAHVSRASYARLFKRVSGRTWNEYQRWWRMQLAWVLLGRGESVLSTALSVGYQSEAAFSRAFKDQFSRSAGEVRRSRKVRI
ncbi:AraC family transcriptional regulator [Saccharospirillum impatiens]|uniref:AraC family transcriptional regulator n=1 Tax=Saccharospirillum impatiens TaxID=169438 RepID=UPI000414FB8F|nr:AraC family transcriptional regulator [Saccharospirillum impatiens]